MFLKTRYYHVLEGVEGEILLQEIYNFLLLNSIELFFGLINYHTKREKHVVNIVISLTRNVDYYDEFRKIFS